MWQYRIVAECDELSQNLPEGLRRTKVPVIVAGVSSEYSRWSRPEIKLETLRLQPSYSVLILILVIVITVYCGFKFLKL